MKRDGEDRGGIERERMGNGFDQNVSHMCMNIKSFKNKKINRSIYVVEKQNALTDILTKQEVDEDCGFYQERMKKEVLCNIGSPWVLLSMLPISTAM